MGARARFRATSPVWAAAIVMVLGGVGGLSAAEPVDDAARGPRTPFGFTDQGIHVLLDEPSDSADLLLVYRGIRPAAEDPDWLGRVERRIAGHRVLDLGKRWSFDLGLAGGEGSREEDALDGSHARSLLDTISLRGAGLFFDGRGRLSMYQHFRIEQVAYSLDFANALFNTYIDENLGADHPVSRTLGLDEPSLERWRKRAAKGDRWTLVRDGGIRLYLPMKPEEWPACVRSVAAADPELWLGVVSGLRLMRLDKTRVILQIGGGGSIRLDLAGPLTDEDPDSQAAERIAALETRGLFADRDLDEDALVQSLVDAARRTADLARAEVLELGLTASAAAASEDWTEALSVAREAVHAAESSLGEADPETQTARHPLAEYLYRGGSFSEAGSLLRRVHAARAESLGEDHELTVRAQYGLGRVLLRQGRAREDRRS